MNKPATSSNRNKRRASKSKSEKSNSNWCKDPNVEIVMLESMEQVIPIDFVKPFSILNIHVALKEDAKMDVQIEQIENRLNELYNYQILETHRHCVDDEDPEDFVLPQDIMEEFGARVIDESSSSKKATPRSKKRK
ncbi:hypothetical protein FDP41_013211 [Naegleria fowleri]|uniref:Uncharacterized protein n=1 Tax=Naegleria fowleri TaxID=5763 RepID=A0A6A5C4D2_NAEFO|nr:uncharacterized protein FDP41_013211 [Naegleria fowleri]KAF0980728.1 hypothetical protein FDP41_013211 [Naegleria fowleri]CAG4710978.1 unnamed protein product [Naegleria fowleri]